MKIILYDVSIYYYDNNSENYTYIDKFELIIISDIITIKLLY